MILLFILSVTISPSAYFTYGKTSNVEANYSTSLYLTLSQHQKYLFFAYDNYHEPGYYQNLFTAGYTQPVINKLWLKSVGFYYMTSSDNIGISSASRIFYGYNPVYSFGYAYSIYSKTVSGVRKFYSIHQLNPEYQRTIYRTTLTAGIIYTNASTESYFAGSAKVDMNLISKANLEIAGLYGKLFHHIDDRLLIINNRLDIQTAKISCRIKYRLPIKGMHIAGVITRNIFDTYHISYYTVGLEYTRL